MVLPVETRWYEIASDFKQAPGEYVIFECTPDGHNGIVSKEECMEYFRIHGSQPITVIEVE